MRILTASRIFTGEEWLTEYAVIIEEAKIREIVSIAELPSSVTIVHYDECIIAPAFVDLQVYGASGRLLAVYPEKNSLDSLVDYCRNGGAAWCLPTVATNTKEVFYRCIDAIRDYCDKGGKGVLGIHLEGPWINKVKRGAHIESLIHAPALQEVKDILEYGKGVIKMITLAPEVCSKEVVELIRSYEVVVSAGHSNASYTEASQSFANGVGVVTHLFNAMSSLHHRGPGLVGATMDNDKVMASIIPDGYHVDYSAIRIAKKAMGDRLFAITDAVTDTNEGYYKHQRAGDKYEAAGVLSGSALTMQKALQNLVQECGIDLGEALRMCSLYPARVLRLDSYIGKIEKGFNADLVVLDNTLQLKQLITA